MNELEYYSLHNISTIGQDISNMQLHLKRRARLYELVGIPTRVLLKADVLEVGAGGGYNALALLLFGANVDIVEPNVRACEDAEKLFTQFKIPKHQYRIFNCLVEEYQNDKIYDFIGAEGFLPTLESQEVKENVVCAMKKLVKPNGNILATSMCEIGYTFEDFRRILGLRLIYGIKGIQEQIEILAYAFESHLKACKFAAKPIKDWVVATILNPGLDATFSSLVDIVKMFCKENHYEVVGMSPNAIPNLSWYRNMDYQYHRVICDEFLLKEHLFLSNDIKDSIREKSKNIRLRERLKEMRSCIKTMKDVFLSGSDDLMCAGGGFLPIVEILELILQENNDIKGRFIPSVQEVITMLKNEKISPQQVANMCFKEAWGQGQQYINFKKV